MRTHLPAAVTTALFAAAMILSPVSAASAQDRPPAQPPGAPQRPAGQDPQSDPAMRDPVNRPAQPVQVRVPPTVEFVADVVYATTTRDDGEPHDLTMNVFFPKNSGDKPLPVIIYIHGGGWTSGDKNIGNQWSAILAAGGYFTCTISYRLVQQARFPAAMHDVKAAVRFLRANAEELGIYPEKIGVWGHSAGGHLASYLGTTGNNPDAHGEVGEFLHASNHVTCVVNYFGPADLTRLIRASNQGRQLRGRLFGDDSEAERDLIESRLRAASPITYVDTDDPPFLMIHGTDDRVVSLEQSRMLHEALTEAGVKSELIVVDGAGHGFRDPDSFLRAVSFFDEHLGGAARSYVESIAEALAPPAVPAERRPPQRGRGDAGAGAGDGGSQN